MFRSAPLTHVSKRMPDELLISGDKRLSVPFSHECLPIILEVPNPNSQIPGKIQPSNPKKKNQSSALRNARIDCANSNVRSSKSRVLASSFILELWDWSFHLGFGAWDLELVATTSVQRSKWPEASIIVSVCHSLIARLFMD